MYKCNGNSGNNNDNNYGNSGNHGNNNGNSGNNGNNNGNNGNQGIVTSNGLEVIQVDAAIYGIAVVVKSGGAADAYINKALGGLSIVQLRWIYAEVMGKAQHIIGVS